MKTKTINVHEVVIRLEIDEREVLEWEGVTASKPLPQQIAECMHNQVVNEGSGTECDSISIEVDGKLEYDSEAPMKKAKKKNGGTR